MTTKRREGGESVPQQMRPTYDAVVALTDQFCAEHLNEEYAELCRKLAAALSRKRPSPLASGPLRTWACGIVYTIGAENFLFDKTQTPHMLARDLAAAFGVAQSTAGNKAKAIRDALKMQPYDWHWCLPSRLDDHPMAWTIAVNGFLVDARRVPREIQEEAFERGLIPYVPAARAPSPEPPTAD